MTYQVRGRVSLRTGVLIILASYCVTIISNATRIFLGQVSAVLIGPHFDRAFLPAIHTTVGAFIFLTFLILTYLTINWGLNYDREQ